MRRNRLRAMGLCLLLLALAGGRAGFGQIVLPEATCGDDLEVDDNFAQTVPVRVAQFGYFNPGISEVTYIAGGSTNFFTPGNPNRGQPSTFSLGLFPYVVTLPHSSTRPLLWVLNDQVQAQVSAVGLKPCTPTAVPFLLPVPLRLLAGSTNLGIELMKVAWLSPPPTLQALTGAVELWSGTRISEGSTPTFPTSSDVTFSNVRVTGNAVFADVSVVPSPSRRRYAMGVKLRNGATTVMAKSAVLEVYNPCSVTVTPGALPSGVVQTAYGPVTLGASGASGPYTFQLGSGRLPAGLQLVNGVISGTPTEAGTFAFSVAVTSADGCLVQQAYTLVVGGPACAVDVTGSVAITLGGFRRNLATGRWQQTVTVVNTSGSAIQGPVSLVVQGLSANASLFNTNGTTGCATPAGRPYVRLNLGAGTTWLTGQAVSTTLEFVNTAAGQAITYTPRVLAGGVGL